MGDGTHSEVDLDMVARFLNNLIEQERIKQRSAAAGASVSGDGDGDGDGDGINVNTTNSTDTTNTDNTSNDASKDMNEDWSGIDPAMLMFLHMDTDAAPTEDSPMDSQSWMKAAFEHDDTIITYQNPRLDTTSQPEPTMLDSLGIPPWPEALPPAPESDGSSKALVAEAGVDVLCHKLRERLDSLRQVENTLDGYCLEMSSRVKDLGEQLTKLHEVVSDNAKGMQEWATKVHSLLEKVSPEP